MGQQVEAFEFPAELDWVNTDQVPRRDQLLGRATLLYFWTCDHVNSVNLLADVAWLESRHHDGLCVIGVHTPRYSAQRTAAAVLKAVNRHHLRHPVANDPGFVLWQKLGVQAWPSVVLLDAQARPVAIFTGEGRRQEIDRRITHLLDDAIANDTRVYEGWPAVGRPEPRLPLAFPARVVATDRHLYIADTAHHRVLETTHEGRILRQFGSGNAGYWDGRLVDCGLASPQGLALAKDALYVADTGNHAVRRIRLLAGDVETVIGTGRAGRDRPQQHGEPTAVGLCAPVDLVAHNEHLYVTVAGQHQVWDLDLTRSTLDVLAGSGHFGLQDGAGAYASFAQPAGIAALGPALFVVDAGAGAVRAIRIADRQVTTVVGAGPWEFGDAAGKRDAVRLQHPQGVAVDPRGLVFVADSYNSKLKAINLKNGETRSFSLPYRFHEPEGVSLAGGALWIANTNAHEIVRVDLANGSCQRVAVGE
ncbi:MAG TPA: thioredoxin-like domain-containing protein [Tahibacter sp.]|uniref:thioredoxin-like domain-containing protein n=1 Tax=Tahibacter sp. TaxID=2056211 RepID=UPI002CFD1D70|nr:thioredoxin-like domain-containing protein [Tahibacter sp.]HSX61895.1 thioredoxin-like domain-containing protein [Tahibacter sp.]